MSQQQQQTIGRFVAAEGLTMDAVMTDRNPHMGDSMPIGSSHWRCEISREDKSMVVYFSMGPALTGPPTLAEVLDAISSDAASVINSPDWLDWAEELGYEGADALRQARTAHRTIERQVDQMRELLGDDALDVLLWNTERL